jgi:hypothetical protein
MSITSSSEKRIQWDKTLVSEAAAGNWSWIHSDLGIPIVQMTPGVPGPCPKKGGKDKLRLFSDYLETGGIVSNEDGTFPTGFHTLAWWKDWLGKKGYSDAVNLVGDYLRECGMLEIPAKHILASNGHSVNVNANPAPTSSRGKGASGSTANSETLSPRTKTRKLFSDQLKVAQTRKKLGLVPIDQSNESHRKAAEKFAKAKPGILAETILNSGCEIGRWYDREDIFSMLAYRSSDQGQQVHAMILYKVSGERFQAYGELSERKVHLVMVKGSGDSWFTVGGPERLRLANFVVKVEGSTDALALAGIVPDDFAVVTNVCGATPSWTGQTAPDFSVITKKQLITIGDNDSSGLGIRSARAFSEIAAYQAEGSFLGAIPLEFKDLRDWIAAGNGWEEFEDVFANAETIPPVEAGRESAVQPGEEEPYELRPTANDHSIKESNLPDQQKLPRQAFIEGQRVRCRDRGNIGVVEEDDGGDTVRVHFVSRDGVQAHVDIPREEICSLDGLTEEPAQQIQIETFSAWDLIDTEVPLDEEIIEGILRRGEVGNVIAATKVGKSWLGLCLACAVATGRRWLGRQTLKGNVLLIDNELRPATLRHRIATVLRAMAVEHDESHARLEVASLRGQFLDIQNLEHALRKFKRDEFALIILDAKYRAFGSLDENSNTDQTLFHNAVDKIAGELNSAFLMIHHSTKGDQGSKSTTDVGSGGGSQARAVDTHLIIRPHSDEGYAVLDAAVRSFAPVASQTLQWEFPLWHLAQSVEPILKAERTRGDSRQESNDRKAIGEMTDVMHKADRHLSRYEIKKQLGWGFDRVNRIIHIGITEGRIVSTGTRPGKKEDVEEFTVKSRLPPESADAESSENRLF